jgi:ethanolamine phosphate transferase 2 subunit G
VGLKGIFHEKYSDLDASVFMKPKEVEMDRILERIYNSLTTKEGERTLMVVCGDHGMNDVDPLLRNI